jgi:(R)-amidase
VSVVLGLTESEDGQFYNSNVLIDERGQLLLRYRKTHLWSCDIGVFSTGNSFDTCLWNGLRVGMLICYDVEFPEPARALGMLGSQLAIVTDGNMDPYGPVHRRAGVARAMENQMFVAIVNRCGRGDNNLTFPGESVLIDPFGDVVASAGAEEVVLKVDVDLTKLESSRRNYNYLDEKRVQLQLKTVERTDGSRSLLIDS